MILPDVNVLVYAFRPDAANHPPCRQWLQSVVEGREAFGMSPRALSSFLRIVTHPRIFARPDALDDALRFTEYLLAQPQCQTIQPGVRHWGIFSDLCRKAKASGNLVPDAWFAALAIEHGCEWITTDRDYSRFPGLRWRAPF